MHQVGNGLPRFAEIHNDRVADQWRIADDHPFRPPGPFFAGSQGSAFRIDSVADLGPLQLIWRMKRHIKPIFSLFPFPLKQFQSSL
ncbi:hypothetical protein D1872_234210 [compost metagenome]